MYRNDLAWAAGLFDGEGCISLLKFRPNKKTGEVTDRYRLFVMLAMCHEKSVRRFAQIVDGGNRVYERRQKTWKNPHWDWRACDVEGERIIRVLLPLLYTKRDQAIAALEYRELCRAQQVGRNRRMPLLPEMMVERARYHSLLRDMKKPSWQEAAHL